MQRTRIVTLLAAGHLLTAGCSGSPGRPANPLPTSRLAPAASSSAAGLDVSRTIDRDTTTAAPVAGTATVTLRFVHDVELRRVKAFGSGVRLRGPDGLVLEPSGAWASAELARPVTTGALTLTVEPLVAGGALAEVEAWGAGLPAAPRDTQQIAEATRDAKASPFENVTVVRADGMPATLTPIGLNEGDPCVRATVRAGVAIRQVRRAYLAYEANVQRATVLRTSIDGGAPTGGFWLAATTKARTVVGELDPERLGGNDSILLCLPDEATGKVSVDGLRLLLVTDDGRDLFDRDAHLTLPAATDGDAGTNVPVHAAPVDATLDRPTVLDGAEVSVAAPPARLTTFGVYDGQAWSDGGALALDTRSTALPLAGRTAQAARLAFAGSARVDVPAAALAEVSLSGSGIGPRVAVPRLVLTSPGLRIVNGRWIGERFDARALVAGWAESPQGPGSVTVDGADVGVDGAFAVPVSRPAGATGAWDVVVRARFPGGAEVERTIHLEDDAQDEILQDGDARTSSSTDSTVLRFGAENQASSGVVDPEKGGHVGLGTEAFIDVPPGAVSAKTAISITRKGPEVVPELEPGMINVTAPPHGGYRFLPKGQKFAKPAQITLPYDESLLPEGVEPEEIRTYYFDEDQDRWIALARKQVQRATKRIVSETTHFTFMINAVLVLPDHPGPASFNPNSIKDLKAADPAAGIDTIEPPTGNNQGSARVTFPIRLPKARGGYQPWLALSYDSSAGAGWVGVGWSLPVSSVSIDTKYGVPAYDGFERYVLDGEQLVPMAGNGACSDGSTGDAFAARVERGFRRIARCGADPTSYWFEVTDRAGVLFVYGRHPAARLASYIPRVTVPARNPPIYDVAEWYLERVVDTNGNLTEYGYELDHRDRNDGVYREDFRQMYLRDVWYTGYADRKGRALEGGESGAYHVHLAHELAGTHPATRPDLVTSGRLGFKTVMRRRLGAIVVELTKGDDAGVIREYRLAYEQGDFGKSRLTSVSVYGAGGPAAGKLFYTHTFQWENASDHATQAFSDPIDWSLPADDGRGISASDSISGGFHVFGGLGLSPTKNVASLGLRVGMNFRHGENKAAFVDVNGDGLPDRIAEGDLAWFNQAVPGAMNASQSFSPFAPPGDPYQGAPSFSDFPGLGSEDGAAIDVGVQVQAAGVLGANFGANYNLTKSRSFLVDANGDGLVDVVQDGVVYLNRPRCGANATCVDPGAFRFEKAWVVSDLGESQSKVDEDPTLRQMAAKSDEALSPEDVVLEWTAPFSGTIDLDAALKFANAPVPGGRHDGVRLRLYRAGTARPLATWYKTPDDLTATAISLRGVPGNGANGFPVGSGDVLYFMLSTLADNELDRPYAPEEISFAPVITYTTVDDGGGPVVPDKSLADAVGTPVFLFDAKADLRLAGDPRGAVSTGRGGTIVLRSHVEKGISGDDVRMCVHVVPHDSKDGKPPDHCPDRPDTATPVVFGYGANETASEDRADTLELAAGDALYFQQETELSIDPATAVWRIDAEMTCPRDAGGGCALVSDLERPNLRFDVVPYLRLRQAVDPAADAYQPYPVPPAPFEVPLAVKPGTTLYFVVHTWSGSNPSVLGARRNGELLFKERGFEDWTDSPRITVHAVTVDPGDRIFFEAFSDKPSYTPWAVGVYDWDPAPQPGCDPTYGGCDWPGPGPIPVNPVVDQPDRAWKYGGAPILPGGYHGWRYGLWQGKEDQPVELQYFRTPDRDELESWNGTDNQQTLAKKKGGFTDPNGDYRKRVALVGVLVPRARGTRAAADDAGLRADVGAFVSPDRTAYVTKDGTMNASRRSLQSAGTAGSVPGAAAGTGAFSIANLSRSSVGVGVNAGVSVLGLGLSLGAGINQQKTDVLDMNGDRIVDTLAAGGVPDLSDISIQDLAGFISDPIKAMWSTDARITDAHGLGTRGTVNFPGLPRLNLDVSGQVGLNVTDAVKYLAKQGGYDVIASALPGAGIGFDLSTSIDDLQDVNGDGLPDMVRKDFTGSCSGFLVRLNLGTSFARNEDCVGAPSWGGIVPHDGIVEGIGAIGGGVVGYMLGKVADSDAVRKQSTVTVSATMAGMIVAGETYGAAVSMDSSLNATNMELVDVTGDGLPDYVFRSNSGGPFWVMVNEGYGFASPVAYQVGQDWPGRFTGMKAARLRTSTDVGQWVLNAFMPQAHGIDPIAATGTHTVLPSVGATFTLSIPLLLFAPPYLYIGGGGGDATPQRAGGFELGLQDVDGDGFVDHVLKTDENGKVLVRRNQLAGGNLLKKVTRPLGGSFELTYVRTGNTVDMPESRWVMSQVKVRDGRKDVESEPGHAFVTTYDYAGGKHDRYEREFLGFASVMRTNPDESIVTQRFLNADVRVKGIIVSDRLEDKKHRPYTETVNTLGAEVAKAGSSDCADHRPFFLSTDAYCSSFFEPVVQTETRLYEGQATPGIVTRQTVEYDDYGNATAVHDWGDVADPGDDLLSSIEYDTSSAGGLHFVDRPKHVTITDGNGRLLRERKGSYDPATGNLTTFEASMGDGRVSTTTLVWTPHGTLEQYIGPPNLHDLRFWVKYAYDDVVGTYVVRSEDVFGYMSSSAYDLRWGEPVNIEDTNHQVMQKRYDDFGRLERIAAEPRDTVDAPTVLLQYAPGSAPAYAVSVNKLPGSAGIRIVTFADGLRRVIQTKKTAEISPTGDANTVIGWSVTGGEQYDAMGRVVAHGQAFFQPGGGLGFAHRALRNPTVSTYDVLGRTLETVAPDGSTTRYGYGFGTPTRSAVLRARQVVTDALGHRKVTWTDAAQRILAMEESIEGRSPTTLYAYNAFGEVEAVTDVAGNVTRARYDLLGNRTALSPPDSGTTTFEYDRGSHLVKRTDAKGQVSSYDYEYERLRSVSYPDARQNITYTYGPPGAAGRAAGRIQSITDAAGEETRTYDELGAIATTTRRLKPMRPGDTWRSFTMVFDVDTFGRTHSMQYPDGEVVEYAYDAGGLVRSAVGTRPATQWNPREVETYLRAMTYDEFDHRVFMQLGNGVTTRYGYEPSMRRLSTVTTITPSGRTLQALSYKYDPVGNIVTLVNALGPASSTEKSGAVSFTYRYDDLYRLTYAHGEAASRPNTIDRFTSTFSFDDIHNMQANVQVHEIVRGGIETPPKTNHAWAYTYAGSGPHQATTIGDRFLVYDADGNTVRECRSSHGDSSCSSPSDHLRQYFWTGENRLDAVIDGGGANVTRFVYDASGNRVVKLGSGGESVTIGQFWALKGRRAATKHVFAGGARVASKLLPPPGWQDAAPSDSSTVVTASTSSTGATNVSGCDPSDYVPQKCPILPGGDPVLNHHFDGERVKPATYYYHPDQLGSIGWVTDQNGRVHEHVEYFPYGEVWRKPRADADGAPVRGQRFLFTGKQLDEETGLYYFGARYLHPGEARWLTCDPADRHSAGQASIGLNPYEYAFWNPATVTDPTGEREPYAFESRYIANLRQWANEERNDPSWLYRKAWGEGVAYQLDRMANDLESAIGRAWEGEPVVPVHPFHIEPFKVNAGKNNVPVDIRVTFSTASTIEPRLIGAWGGPPANVPGAAPRLPAPGEIGVWDVAPYGAMPSPRPPNTQAHHGVLNAWGQRNIPGYSRAEAPTILMPNHPSHNATREVYPRWAEEIARRQGVRNANEIDFSKVTEGQIWRLAEEEFEAAGAPEWAREEYFRRFNEYREQMEREPLEPRVEPVP